VDGESGEDEVVDEEQWLDEEELEE